jgi:hypothetical protein
MSIIFASVLEEFACLPELFLVSTIVLIGSVRPNQCLGVTLFSYFRFLYVTCENYGVKRQGNLLTKILLSRQYVSTSARQYASTSVCQYVSMPLCGMAAVRQYVSTSVCQYVSSSVRQYASTSVCQYVSTSCYLSYIKPNTNFNSYMKNLRFFYSGRTDGQTDREINLVWASIAPFLQVK